MLSATFKLSLCSILQCKPVCRVMSSKTFEFLKQFFQYSVVILIQYTQCALFVLTKSTISIRDKNLCKNASHIQHFRDFTYTVLYPICTLKQCKAFSVQGKNTYYYICTVGHKTNTVNIMGITIKVTGEHPSGTCSIAITK